MIKKCVICNNEFKTVQKNRVSTCSKKCLHVFKFNNFIEKVKTKNNIDDLGEWLRNAYLIQLKTFRMILKELNINNRSVPLLLNYYNIPVRKGTEAVKAQWTEERRCKRILRNSYETYGDISYIICFDKKGIEKARIKIDTIMLEKVKKFQWNINNLGYATAWCEPNNRILIHRLITDIGDNKLIDHINHIPLDNRLCNLRVVTHMENSWNRSISCVNNTGVKGVSLEKSGKWLAGITCNKVIYRLGLFESKEDAIKARREAEIKYFGEYRNIS